MALTATHRPSSVARPGQVNHNRGSALLLVAIMALALLAVGGAWMAADIVRNQGTAGIAPLADPAAQDLGLGQAIRTSFGSLMAAEALINNGLSSEDMGGMSHGVSGFVGTGSAQVNVVVTLHNTGNRAVGIDATQFTLLVGSKGGVPAGKPIKASGTTLQAGGLAGRASVDARVTFVAPTNGARLWLQFTDPHGGARPIRIELGRTGVAKPAAKAHH